MMRTERAILGLLSFGHLKGSVCFFELFALLLSHKCEPHLFGFYFKNFEWIALLLRGKEKSVFIDSD
jgi:hypothetical protein